MPINPQHHGSFTLLDHSNEKSAMRFNFGAITAVSLPGFLTDFGALRTAVENITLGSLIQDQWTGDTTRYNNAAPADPSAQRERKFLVSYQGAVTFSRYEMEIPTADLTGRMIAGTDLVDRTNTEVAAFETAFETLARTPEGEAVQVLEIRAVGRNI